MGRPTALAAAADLVRERGVHGAASHFTALETDHGRRALQTASAAEEREARYYSACFVAVCRIAAKHRNNIQQ